MSDVTAQAFREAAAIAAKGRSLLARTLVQTLGDQAERFRRERDEAREERDLLRESTTAALNLVTKLHTPS